MSIPNVAQPLISDTFQSSVSQTQWVSLSYLLVSSLLMVPAGRVADSLGRVKVLLVGIAIFLLGALLAGFAPTLLTLATARGLMGVGGAAMTALPVALVRQSVPADRVGRTMGIIGSSVAAGWALGPAAGGVLAAAFGWRWVFFVLIPLGGVALILAWWALPTRKGGTGLALHSDLLGLLILALALVCYSVGLTLRPFGAVGTAVLALAGVLFLVLFVLVERRASTPLVDFALLARVRVYPGLITAFLASLIMMSFTVIPPFYLSRGLELDAGQVGLAMAVGPTVAILSGVPAGRLVERFGPRPIFVTGLTFLSAASLAFTVLPRALGLAGFFISAVMLTPGNQMFMAANNTSVTARSGAEHQGVVAGVLSLSRNLGSITGVALAAPLFDAAVARIPGPLGATVGLQVSFSVAAGLGLLGLGIALFSGRQEGREAR